MTQIWKYPLEVTDDQYISAPMGAKPLSVDVQHGTPCIWAEVDPGATSDSIRVRIFGTGHNISGSGLQFVGTFQLHGGSFVGHVYTVQP